MMLLGGTLGFSVVAGEMHMTIPFQFNVEGRTLPAGRYVITNPATGNLNLIEIRSQTGGPNVFVLTEPVSPSGNSRKPDLVFRQVNGMEYLAQVWADPGSPGNAIPLPGNQTMATQARMQRHHARGMQMPAASGE